MLEASGAYLSGRDQSGSWNMSSREEKTCHAAFGGVRVDSGFPAPPTPVLRYAEGPDWKRAANPGLRPTSDTGVGGYRERLWAVVAYLLLVELGHCLLMKFLNWDFSHWHKSLQAFH